MFSLEKEIAGLWNNIETSPSHTVKRVRQREESSLLDVSTDGAHRPESTSDNSAFGPMVQYLLKMGKYLYFLNFLMQIVLLEDEQWPSFNEIGSKPADWPGDTETQGLGPHCLWKAGDGRSSLHLVYVISLIGVR